MASRPSRTGTEASGASHSPTPRLRCGRRVTANHARTSWIAGNSRTSQPDSDVLPHVGLVRGEPRADRRRGPRVVEQRPSRPGAEHRGVVDAVPAGQDRADHREGLAAAVRPVLGQQHTLVDQPWQSIRCASIAAGSSPAFGIRFVSVKFTDTRLRS
jgi:hypothetical protein